MSEYTTEQQRVERYHRIISRRKFIGGILGLGGILLTKAGLDDFTTETLRQASGPGPSSFFQLNDVRKIQSFNDGDVWAYQSSGNQWLNKAPTSLTSFQHAILSTQHSDTLPASAVAGDLISANSTPLWSRVPIGSSLQYLTVVSGLPAWRTPLISDISVPFSAEGTILSPTAAINVIIWRALFACTVTALKGYRVGGTSATVNAGKGTTASPTSRVLSSDLSLSSTETWTDGGAVQNTAFAVGDPLIIILASVAGSPTQIGIQVDFTAP